MAQESRTSRFYGAQVEVWKPGMSNEYSMNEGAGRVGEEEEAVIAL